MNQMICIWTNMNKTTICKTHRHRHDMLLVYSNAHVTHYMYIYILYLYYVYTLHIKYTLFHWYNNLFFKPPTHSTLLKRDIHPWQSTQADQKLVFQNHLLEDQAKPFEVLCEFEYIIQCLGAFFGVGFFWFPEWVKSLPSTLFFLEFGFSVPA